MREPVRILVVGAGGISSWLIPGLARACEFQAPMSQITVVDGDNFEHKNAERQNFKGDGNKAQVIVAELRDVVPNTFLIAKPAWVVSKEFAGTTDEDDPYTVQKITAESLMSEGCYVFVGVDNHSARKLVFEAATKFNNIDIFSGGNGTNEEGDALFGSVYHYCRRDGVDVTANMIEYHDEVANPTDKNTGELSCTERAEVDGGSQVLAVNMAVASWLLAKATHVIFGTDKQREAMLEHAEVYFDLEKGAARSSSRKPTTVDATLQTV